MMVTESPMKAQKDPNVSICAGQVAVHRSLRTTAEITGVHSPESSTLGSKIACATFRSIFRMFQTLQLRAQSLEQETVLSQSREVGIIC